MTPDEYEQVTSIFLQVCDLPPSERTPYLDEACRLCPHLRNEIEAMLTQDQAADTARGWELLPTSSIRALEYPGLEPIGFSAKDQDSRSLAAADFAGYELLSEIGRGGMGVVYKALQKQPSRIVALKMIRGAELASPLDVRRFHSEAQAAANLNHEGVIPIYEVGQHNGKPFFSMKYVEGQSFGEHLRCGNLTQRERIEILKAACDAVAHCHQKGIVHRDLKPSNILLDQAHRVCVADCGLAKQLYQDSSMTAAGDVLGTPGYMPPEQASGSSDSIGPQADVYALGAILYHILTGRPPIQAERVNLASALHLIQEHDVVPPRRVDRRVARDLDTICMHCLEKDPARRYPDAGHLAAELQRYLDGEPVQAKPLGWPRGVLRWARQQPGLATTWAALLLFYSYHLADYFFLGWTIFERWGGDAAKVRFHYLTTAVVISWAVGAWVFQRLLLISGGRAAVLFLWATMDVALLTVQLGIGDGAVSTLVCLYQVLVAGAILRFRSDIVAYVTVLCSAGYLILTIWGLLRGLKLVPQVGAVVPFVFSLFLLGLIQCFALRRSTASSLRR